MMLLRGTRGRNRSRRAQHKEALSLERKGCRASVSSDERIQRPARTWIDYITVAIPSLAFTAAGSPPTTLHTRIHPVNEYCKCITRF